MQKEQEKRLAVLIDAENISDKYIKTIMDEAANLGVATYKRIYGDWTGSLLNSWKTVLLENSIIPIQQYHYTYGKSSSDSAMIIDAMDILYSGNVEGFCIVSSDSDFTRLASRLRESGMVVIGMGERKTPKPFITSCNQFKYLDILTENQEKERKSNIIRVSQHHIKDDYNNTQADLEAIKKTLLALAEESSDEDGWLFIGDVGNQLAKRFPDFDVRNYGFKKLTPFLKSLKLFELRAEPAGEGRNVKLIYIRLKNNHY
ncbi:MAG: NYN domain-containing protein [Firmicutes bacterium]|nr:NYN domain-containing protein [Bacillota bacterium]